MGLIEGNITLSGDPRLRAGMSVTIAGFGAQLDGEYIIKRVRHVIARGQGFVSDIDISSNPLATPHKKKTPGHYQKTGKK
jgi:phage protein D